MMFDISVFSAYVRLALKLFTVVGLASAFLLWVSGNLGRMLKAMYNFDDDAEMTKFSLLALCFSLVIGTYWMLRTTKDAVFNELVGVSYIPRAKQGTILLIILVLFLFNFIVDRVRKHRLFTIVCVFYSALFAGIALAWKLGLAPMTGPLFDWIPGRALGWTYYWAVETLGGVLVGAVFWPFVSSTTKTESAKRGYPFIFLGAQLGNFVGPAFNAGYSTIVGNQNLILMIAGLLMLIPVIIEYYMAVIPAHLHESDDSAVSSKKKKTGVLEGLRLLATRPYLMGVAVVSVIYEVTGTITDYQFKVLSNQQFIGSEFTAFMSFFAMVSALVAMAFAAGGTSFVVRKFGVRLSLLGYPLSVAAVVLLLWLKPTLWGFFVGMVVIKAFAYALNSPVKELLYLPTSKDAKMKAKGFIEGIGGKGAKGVGAVITDNLKGNIPLLINVGSLVSLGIIGLWIIIALMVGSKYDQLRSEDKIVD